MTTPAGVAATGQLRLRIHHVGYAVANIAAYLESHVIPLFEPRSVSSIIEDPIQRVRIVFVELPGGSLELIEPTSSDSPVQEILKRRRGGLYHVAYATSNFDLAMAQIVGTGCRPLARPAPAAAFDQRRVVFFMTPYFDLIELVEMPETTIS